MWYIYLFIKMKLQLRYSEKLQKRLENAISFCKAGSIYTNKKKGIIYIEPSDRTMIHSQIKKSDIIPNEANIITLAKCLML